MTDELIMNNYLLLLKSTCEVYVHGTLESANDSVRNVLKSGLDNILLEQHNTYNLMVDNGWYSVSNVGSSIINKCIKGLES